MGLHHQTIGFLKKTDIMEVGCIQENVISGIKSLYLTIYDYK